MARRKDQPDASAAETDVTPADAAGATARPVRSRRKRKGAELSGTETAERAVKARNQLTPRWWITTMVTLMVLGLAWIVVYYVAGDRIGLLDSLGPWNFAIGFGAMVAGLVMSMRWR